MTTRDELYIRFGPVLLEALMRVLLSQVNVLRLKAGLEEITVIQAVNAIQTELEGLPPYDWMNDRF